METLRGRNALLTGASRGIGVHIARALAAEGVNLALVARSREPIERLAGELAGRGIQATALACDLESADSARLVADVEQRLGTLDILVNNAALDLVGAYVTQDDASLERVLRLDLLQPMQLARAALPGMLARRCGHIVNIASLAGKNAAPYNVSYGAAKGGLIAFSHSLRAELHDSGVGVSVVCPGFIAEEGMFADMSRPHGVKVSPLIGTSRPEQVARAVVRAIAKDRAEILVNPGPIRLVQVFNQLAPDVMARIQDRMGVARIFRTMSLPSAGAATRRDQG